MPLKGESRALGIPLLGPHFWHKKTHQSEHACAEARWVYFTKCSICFSVVKHFFSSFPVGKGQRAKVGNQIKTSRVVGLGSICAGPTVFHLVETGRRAARLKAEAAKRGGVSGPRGCWRAFRKASKGE